MGSEVKEESASTLKARMDEFYNAVAGMGDPKRDKATHTVYLSDDTLQRTTLNALFRSSWLARRLCTTTAGDATKNWWRIESTLDGMIQDEVKRLNLRRKVKTALTWCNLYGQSALLINEGNSATTSPIENLRYIESVRVVAGGKDSPQLKPVRGPDGEAIGWIYYPSSGGAGMVKLDPVEYHPSRVILFEQDQIPPEILEEEEWCPDSVLQNTWNAMRRYGVALQAGENYVYERQFIVMKLRDMVHSTGLSNMASNFISTITEMIRNKSTYRAIFLGKDDELQVQDLSMSGLPEFYTGLRYEVSGAAEIPVTRLFGQSPGGMNATGEFDTNNYYSRIEVREQDGILRAPLEQLVRALMFQSQGPTSGTVSTFNLEFNPLSVASAKEKEEQDTSRTNRLLSCVREGVLLPEEVRLPLFPVGNQDEVQLDVTAFAEDSERRNAMSAALSAPLEEDEEEEEEEDAETA